MTLAKAAFMFCAPLLALALHADAPAPGSAARAQRRRGTPVKKMNKLQTGRWGGRGVRMDVTAGGARVEFDCAHGTLDGPVTLDRNNRFDVRGTFTRERGGPTVVPENTADGETPPDAGAETLPARYAGRVRGASMSLTVTLAAGEALEGLTLQRGREAVLVKCL